MSSQSDTIIELKNPKLFRSKSIIQPVLGGEIPEGTLRSYTSLIDVTVNFLSGFFIFIFVVAAIILSAVYTNDSCAKSATSIIQSGLYDNPQLLDFMVLGVAIASALSYTLNSLDAVAGSLSRRVLPLSVIVFLMQAISYGLMATNVTYIYCWENNGQTRIVYPLRYFYWACANPLVLIACCRIIGISPWRIFLGALATLICMLLGLGGELVPVYSPKWMVAIIFSCLLGSYVFFLGGKIMYTANYQAELQWKMYYEKYGNMLGFENKDHDRTARVMLRIFIPVIGSVWIAFPIVYILAQIGAITLRQELLIYPALDGFSKIILCNVISTIAKLYSRADAREQQALVNATLTAKINHTNSKGQQALLQTFASQLRLPLRTLHIAAAKAYQRVSNILEDESSQNLESQLDFITGSASRPVTPPNVPSSVTGNHVTFAIDKPTTSDPQDSGSNHNKSENQQQLTSLLLQPTSHNNQHAITSISGIQRALLQGGALDALETVKLQATILNRVIDDFISLHASKRRSTTSNTISTTNQSSISGSNTNNNFGSDSTTVELDRLNITNFSLLTVIEGSIASLQGTALRHGVTVLFGRSKAVPEQVFGDEPRIRYIIMALLAKSLSLCTPGGRVEVRVSGVGFRRIPLRVVKLKDYNDEADNGTQTNIAVQVGTDSVFTVPVPFVRISVTDDGAGLDDKSVNNMFQLPAPLLQQQLVRLYSVQKSNGSQLTLVNEAEEEDDEMIPGGSVNLRQYMNDTMYLCRSISEAMGGTVGVSSIRGTGTMLFTDLPAFASDPRLLTKHDSKANITTKVVSLPIDSEIVKPVPRGTKNKQQSILSQPSDKVLSQVNTIHIETRSDNEVDGDHSVISAANNRTKNYMTADSHDIPILDYSNHKHDFTVANKNQLKTIDDPLNTHTSTSKTIASSDKSGNPPVEAVLQAYTTVMKDKAHKTKSTVSSSNSALTLTEKEKQLGSLLLKLNVTNVR